MCGIVGVLSAEPIDPHVVERMRDTLAHRGPDHAGLWVEKDRRACMGHRRLAIVDLSPEANQPFLSADGRFVISFNGEIYNFREIRGQLESKGTRFRTRSDTEVLLEAFREWGDNCPRHMDGMFAFAIWDARERKLFCARDRVGEKPFYYAQVAGSFIFASEVKALVGWPGFRREMHYPALVDFLSFGYVPDPKCIWEGCRKLPPGHRMWVDLEPSGQPLVRESSAYWDLEFDPEHRVANWSLQIQEALQFASRQMAVADVPVGAFLSGGVDSSSVTAALRRQGSPVSTFTVGFQEEWYDERRWASLVAKQYGTTHVERTVMPDDVESVFDGLLWHYDEPFNDYSYLPTFYLCREARRDVTVALSGDGGDELFAGYQKYQRLAARQDVGRFLPTALAPVLARLTTALLPSANPIANRLLPYLERPEAVLGQMLTIGLPLGKLRAAARGPLATTLRQYTPVDVIGSLLEKAPPARVGLINAMRYLDLKLTLAGDILVKVDRASMAVSLEVRPVYLHSKMIDLARRIPPHQLVDRRHSKKALKTALRTWLPDSLLDRRKMGFALPLKEWLRTGRGPTFEGSGRECFLDSLLDPALFGDMIRTHISGTSDMTSAIHQQILLQRWLSLWVGGETTNDSTGPGHSQLDVAHPGRLWEVNR